MSLRDFDNRLALKIQGWPDGFYRLMWMGSWFGDPVIVLSTAFCSFAIALYWDNNSIARAFIWAVFSFCLAGLIKVTLMRPRPNNHYATSMWIGGYSFPSGHAFGSLVIYGLLAYLAHTRIEHPAGYLISTGIGVGIFIIGLSRIYLGAHYPKDVLGGWILSAIALALIVRMVL